MHWVRTLDVSLFHWVNQGLQNACFDKVMPFCSGNAFFAPVLLLACAVLLVRGGARGRVCVLMLVAAVAVSDGLVCNTLKHLISRPRPFFDIADAHLPPGIGRSDSGSMPSSHAANWFAAMLVMLVYYRRSVWFMLPAALVVSFSRVYNGVHYPSDVLVGAILGAGSAAAVMWGLENVWRTAGSRWFPLWSARLPSLTHPVPQPEGASLPASVPPEDVPALRDRQLLLLAGILIFVHLVAKLVYIGSGKLDLEEDEAYQWIWSKHLALGYYSKPPMIAYSHFLSTHIWGDTVFGVRFFSPVITAVVSFVTLRWLSKAVNARAAFWLVVALLTVPICAIGSTLMTIDPLSVMFWMLAMIAGWRAAQPDARTSEWLWVGLWMGLGIMSKYTGLFQLLSWAAFFCVWPPARKQLGRPGPYLALLVILGCTLPAIIWLWQHHWVTVRHIANGGGLDKPWSPTPANIWYGFRHYTLEFVGGDFGAMNPVFAGMAAWAAVAVFRRKEKNPLCAYLLCMSLSVVVSYFLLSFRSRIQLNWIAPAVVPILICGAVYWERRWREGCAAVKYWLVSGLVLGGVAVLILHDGSLITKISGWPLPPKLNPLRRVQGWKETAQAVEAARQKLLAEGKPVFIIGGHYGITSEVTFNLPEAKAGVPDNPLAYYKTSTSPDNQFYYWPGYKDRKGQNAIYVQELDFVLFSPGHDRVPDVPGDLVQEFESVTNLGSVVVQYRGGPIRKIQIAECRGLR